MVIVVVLAVLAVVVGALLIRLGTRFPERLRASSRAAFECQLPAGVVVHRLLACAHTQRGWRVETADQSAISIRAGTTLFAWRKRIEVSVWASTQVTSTVSIVSSSPQIYDWGDNRRAVGTLGASLADAVWPT